MTWAQFCAIWFILGDKKKKREIKHINFWSPKHQASCPPTGLRGNRGKSEPSSFLPCSFTCWSSTNLSPSQGSTWDFQFCLVLTHKCMSLSPPFRRVLCSASGRCPRPANAAASPEGSLTFGCMPQLLESPARTAPAFPSDTDGVLPLCFAHSWRNYQAYLHTIRFSTPVARSSFQGEEFWISLMVLSTWKCLQFL